MRNFRYDVAIIGGAGHIGLPLALAFADQGKSVLAHDIDAAAFETIAAGKMPFMDAGSEEVLQRVLGKSLSLSTDCAAIAEAEIVIITIGTPVDEHLNPQYRSMKQFANSLAPHLRDGQLVIFRSTLYPSSTERMREVWKRNLPELEVCFCPERIAQGHAMEELHALPQIVSGFEPWAIDKAKALFRLLTPLVVEVNPLEAELTKLFTNSYRYIQFAAANQFYMIAGDYGADFKEIYRAMTYEYPRMRDFPKAGFASGPCLFKDTMQLSAFTNNRFFLGHNAMLINEGLPNYLVEKVKAKHDLSRMTSGILGMAFKADCDDKRDSLAYKLRKILEIESREVYCSDCHIHEEGFIGEEEMIDKCDIVFLGAMHQRYRSLDFKGKIVVDVWDAIDEAASHGRLFR